MTPLQNDVAWSPDGPYHQARSQAAASKQAKEAKANQDETHQVQALIRAEAFRHQPASQVNQ